MNLQIISSLDYDGTSPTRSYPISISVSDGVNTDVQIAGVVNVDPVNEHDPEFPTSGEKLHTSLSIFWVKDRKNENLAVMI